MGGLSQIEEAERKLTLSPETSAGSKNLDSAPRMAKLPETKGIKPHSKMKGVIKITSDLIMKYRLLIRVSLIMINDETFLSSIRNKDFHFFKNGALFVVVFYFYLVIMLYVTLTCYLNLCNMVLLPLSVQRSGLWKSQLLWRSRTHP